MSATHVNSFEEEGTVTSLDDFGGSFRVINLATIDMYFELATLKCVGPIQEIDPEICMY